MATAATLASSRPPAVPPRPEFATHAEARADAKRRLVAAFRTFWKLGFDEGVMGHISFRDPEHPDRFWQNPFGLSFGLIRVSDLVCIDLAGDLVEGSGFPHIGGVPQHAAIYLENPDVRAVAHVHSVNGKAWSTLGLHLSPISTEAAIFHNRHALFDTYAHGEGRELGEAAQGQRAVILLSHGILTVGASVDEAAYLFISLEKVCQEQLLARAAGDPKPIADDVAERIASRFGPYNGWLNFQPAFETILREQPDLVE